MREYITRAQTESYIRAQPIIALLRRYSMQLTMEEFREIRRQALDGDLDGAYEKLNERLEERRK